MEMTKKIYLEPFKKCPESLCFTLLCAPIHTCVTKHEMSRYYYYYSQALFEKSENI